MFSALGSMFTIRPRQAETTDTRQGIRRHDPDYERKKQKKKTAEEELFNQQDSATVSIDALSLFLQSFIKSLETDSKNAAETTATDIPDISHEAQNKAPPTNQISGQAAQAVSAYQTTAQTYKRSSSILDSTDKAVPDIGLEASEIRTIHILLNDLKLLSEQNIGYVQIERSENFLQSLIDAVERAKK